MDYSKLSGGEVSVRPAYFLKPRYSAIIHPHETTGANLSRNWFSTVQNTGYSPLHRAEELFPVMKKYRIGLPPSGKAVWQASHESGTSVIHCNPLRVVAIAYLLLQESANAQDSPA